MTQAIGKVAVNFHDVDMSSFSGHKIYGPKGIGVFYKSSRINIAPVLYGSSKDNSLHPGTISLPLVVSLSKAIRLALMDLDKKKILLEDLMIKYVMN